ncbi:MAG: hypothetical protein RMK20_08690, partial [Verrucomicrobiales bacterium]|nr:hypothetical protein [Verrucomicrobiales bacterium]
MLRNAKSATRYKIRRKIPNPRWSLSEVAQPHLLTSPRRKALEDTQLALRTVATAAPVEAQPFLKWVGGKSQLLSQLDQFFPPDITRYFEPF